MSPVNEKTTHSGLRSHRNSESVSSDRTGVKSEKVEHSPVPRRGFPSTTKPHQRPNNHLAIFLIALTTAVLTILAFSVYLNLRDSSKLKKLHFDVTGLEAGDPRNFDKIYP